MAQAASENSCREKYATPQAGARPASVSIGYALAPLLVSVRDQYEAAAVAGLPFEILDLKEPDRGPLGACSPDVWHACLESNPLRAIALKSSVGQSSVGPSIGQDWSVALGEQTSAMELVRYVPAGVRFAKAGPAGLPDTRHLFRMWDDLRERLAEGVELVAVAYADWEVAGSPQLEIVVAGAAEQGFKTILIDTFDKHRGSVFKLLGADRIKNVLQTAASSGCEVVLAGGITYADASRALSYGCRRIGLRGALCRGPRNGEIDPRAVIRWSETFLRRPAGEQSN